MQDRKLYGRMKFLFLTFIKKFFKNEKKEKEINRGPVEDKRVKWRWEVMVTRESSVGHAINVAFWGCFLSDY